MFLSVFGGPHPTFFPELIQQGPVDIVCRGEGEQTILELADKFDQRKSFEDTANCWVKTGDQVTRNPLRRLVTDLDSLPNPDRALYRSKYPYLAKSTASFMAGRGCPYKCSFCFNHAAQEMYKGLGHWVRLRSPSNVISEIVDVSRQYKLRTVYMQDDTLLLNKRWVVEFADLYRQKVGLPLLCLLRVDQVNEEIVVKLKAAGLTTAFFGIESGDEHLRNHLLKKGVQDSQIYQASELLRKYSIRFRTYNMLGLPGETLEQAMKTLRLNAEIKTDYPWCSLFYPFPGTELTSQAVTEGFLSEDDLSSGPPSFFKDTLIHSAHSKELANLQKLFYYGVRFPFLIPVIERLIKLPPNRLFDVLFLISYAIALRGSENLTTREVISMGIRNVRRFYYTSSPGGTRGMQERD